MADNKTPSPVPDLHRNRLPTLFEVLSRRTLAPVDLFFFYIYMRDQQRSVDYLDFWLDVAQHMSMCRHYVRELRRSVMIGTPDGEKSGSKRSSGMLEGMGNMDHPAGGPSKLASDKEKYQDAQMSAYLRSEGANGNGIGHSPSTSVGSNNIAQTNSNERPPHASFMDSPNVQTSDSSPDHTVSRTDIRQSAEKILYTFLLPGAEREIGIPDQLVQDIIISIEEHGRDDPEVFDAAKDYVFQAMERDAFPGFLRAKALGNLVPTSMTLRLVIGLLSIFAAFWGGFILIFLNYPRHKRVWVSIFCVNLLRVTANFISARPSLHNRSLLFVLSSICSGPYSCSCRLQRVHFYEVFQDSRTICSAATQ